MRLWWGVSMPINGFRAFILRILHLPLTRQFIKFCMVGGVSTIFNYALFFVLFTFGVHYLIASGSGYILGVFLGFLLNKRFTFESTSKRYDFEFFKYILVYGISLFIGLGFLRLLVSLGISVLLANAFTIALTTTTNFLGSRFFVFERKDSLS